METVRRLLQHEAAGGVAMMLAALIAIALANSPGYAALNAVLESTLSVTINGVGLSKHVLLWINDGLMAVFFFRVGLELKYELREGRLRRPADVVLPGLGALGGMVLPALFYAGVVMAFGQRELLAGWAIPCATDIAFALGVLALAGTGLPPSLKTFLLTLAILDDIGAILIIAIFYGHGLHLEWLIAALVPLAGLVALNFSGIRRLGPSILLSIVLWVMVLESGVHATIAGVVEAFCIPLKAHDDSSPLHILDHMLAPYVTFLIVPVFALANAGVVIPSISALSDPLSLAIGAGLVLGKPLGVMGAVLLATRVGLARWPAGATGAQMWGIAALAGIGFTMSLFIGGLSFADGPQENAVRLGVLTASVISALVGFGLLRSPTGQPEAKDL